MSYDRSVVFSGFLVSSTNKTDCHEITEILLKVALNTTNQPTIHVFLLKTSICKTKHNYSTKVTIWLGDDMAKTNVFISIFI